MKKLSLCILFGGKSTEYEVSLRSAYAVLTNADTEKYDLIPVGITKNGSWYLYKGTYENIKNGDWCSDIKNLSPVQISTNQSERAMLILSDKEYRRILVDIIFPVMHGAFAEDGTLQGLLEISGIPFVGSGCACSAVCMDKAYTKQILENYDIPMAHYIAVNSEQVKQNYTSVKAKIEKKFNYPVFIKPSNSGSSVGASKVHSADELESALTDAAIYDTKILVEEYIDGTEIEVAILGNTDPVVSVCGEIDPGSEFYDYETKYTNDTANYYIPARINPQTSERIRYLAAKVYLALGCRGLSRVDFFVRRDDEKAIFNEINTLPGFTSISMYPKLIMNMGMSFPDIIDKLVQLAQN